VDLGSHNVGTALNYDIFSQDLIVSPE
jgi:hypothetical protein